MGGGPAHRFLEAETNEIVPAPFRGASHAFVACDDQSLRRAGHRNIQKAPVFAGLGIAPFRPRSGDGFAVLRRLSAPAEQRRVAGRGGSKPQQLRVVTSVGRPARVGQKDDRGFEPLAGMDRKNAHAVAFGLHVALDRRVGLLDLGQEQGQRGRFALIVGERQGEKFVDRIRRVGPEP